jgi:Phospholipase_D-nuclease N-terminal
MESFAALILADVGGLFLLPIALLAFAFWLWMVVDCARHDTGSTMIAWLLAILFAGIIAAPLYFWLRRLPRRLQTPQFDLAPSLYQRGEKIRGSDNQL